MTKINCIPGELYLLLYSRKEGIQNLDANGRDLLTIYTS